MILRNILSDFTWLEHMVEKMLISQLEILIDTMDIVLN